MPICGFATTITMSAAGTWAGAAGQNGSDIADAAAGDNVALDGNILTVTNDQTSNDGSGLNTFNIGAITDSNAGSVLIDGTQAVVNSLTVNMAATSVGSDFQVENTNGADANEVTTTVSGPLSTGTLEVLNNQATSGALDNLIVQGNLTATGLVTITGNAAQTAGINSNAVLYLEGATNSASGFSLAVSGASPFGNAYLEIGSNSTSQTVTGAIDSAAPGTFGVVILGQTPGGTTSNNITMESNIGATDTVGILEMNGTGTYTFNGTVNTTELYVNADSTNIFNQDVTVSNDAEFWNGDGSIIVANGVNMSIPGINSGGGFGGTVIFDGSSTFTGDIEGPLNQLSLAGSGSTVTVNGLVNTNNTSLGTNTLNVTGAYIQQGSGVLATTINNANTYGKIIAAGNATVPGSTTLDVNVTGPLPTTATSFDIVEGNGTPGVNVPGTVSVTGSTRTFTAMVSSGDLVLDLTAGGFTSATTNGNGQAAATVLDNISGTATGDMANVLTVLGNLPANQVNAAVNSMLPLTGLNQQASSDLMDGFVGTQMTHLETTGNLAQAQGDGQTGMAAGDQPGTFTAWSQAFGTAAHQSPQGTSNGYDLEDAGGTVGLEDILFDSFRLGMAIGDAYSWIQSKDDNGRTDINATQYSLYGGYKADENPLYLNYSLSYGYNKYTGSRDIYVGPAMTREAKSNYDGDLYGATIEGGYGINISPFVVTPNFTVDYNHLFIPKYSEYNAGALDLKVGEQNDDRLRLEPGFKLELPQDLSWGTLTPEFHAKYLYDVISGKDQIVASFAGGGTAFTTVGYKPANQGADVGLSLTLATKMNITVSLQYDLEIREDYYSNTGLMNVAYKF